MCLSWLQKPLLVCRGRRIIEANIFVFLFPTTFHTQRQFPALFSYVQGTYRQVLLRDAWSERRNSEHPTLYRYSKSNPNRPGGVYLLAFFFFFFSFPTVTTSFLLYVFKGRSSCLEDNALPFLTGTGTNTKFFFSDLNDEIGCNCLFFIKDIQILLLDKRAK